MCNFHAHIMRYVSACAIIFDDQFFNQIEFSWSKFYKHVIFIFMIIL